MSQVQTGGESHLRAGDGWGWGVSAGLFGPEAVLGGWLGP